MDSTKVKDALVQIALRMIPIVPGNEVKTLFNALTAKDSEIDQKVEEALTSLNKTSSVITQLESAVLVITQPLGCSMRFRQGSGAAFRPV
jgi:hypothetical protein